MQKRRTRGANDAAAKPAPRSRASRSKRTPTTKLVALRLKGDALLRHYAERFSTAYQGVAALIIERSRLLLSQIRHGSLHITPPSTKKYRIGAG